MLIAYLGASCHVLVNGPFVELCRSENHWMLKLFGIMLVLEDQTSNRCAIFSLWYK